MILERTQWLGGLSRRKQTYTGARIVETAQEERDM